jgi:hypothetical protein
MPTPFAYEQQNTAFDYPLLAAFCAKAASYLPSFRRERQITYPPIAGRISTPQLRQLSCQMLTRSTHVKRLYRTLRAIHRPHIECLDATLAMLNVRLYRRDLQ